VSNRHRIPEHLEAELVGGLHDGRRVSVSALHELLESAAEPNSAVEPVTLDAPADTGKLRYRLDHAAAEAASSLAPKVARYLYQPLLGSR
jgi:ribosomal 50S subunit-associated protein YjgA (DUF615 family)